MFNSSWWNFFPLWIGVLLELVPGSGLCSGRAELLVSRALCGGVPQKLPGLLLILSPDNYVWCHIITDHSPLTSSMTLKLSWSVGIVLRWKRLGLEGRWKLSFSSPHFSSCLGLCLQLCFESLLGSSTDTFNSWLGTVVRAKDAVIQQLSPMQLFSQIKQKWSLPLYVLQAPKVALVSVRQCRSCLKKPCFYSRLYLIQWSSFVYEFLFPSPVELLFM